jgi:hypothetical protein
MTGFRNIKAVVDARAEGRYHTAHLRKAPSAATIAVPGWWFDLSGVTGNPLPNFYASSPLEADTLDGFKGIFHGDAKSPSSMHLLKAGLMSPSAGLLGQYKLCDYLLFYPFIDGDELSEQVMTNNISIPRYENEGGLVMAVVQAPTIGGGSFNYTYTNQDDEIVTSPTIAFSTSAANIGNLVTSQQAVALQSAPFLPLANGDTFVKRIESVQVIGATGGLFALVICRPIVDIVLREANTVSEMSFVEQRPGAPRIYDGAYLNLICYTPTTIANGVMSGYFEFAWSAN